jgi:signal transduction histidine kinase
MRERATELGGSCAITRGEGGGTVLHVRLPLTAHQPA